MLFRCETLIQNSGACAGIHSVGVIEIQRWWSNAYYLTSAVFVSLSRHNSSNLKSKNMAGKKVIKKTAHEAKPSNRGRPRKNAKAVFDQFENEVDLDDNANLSQTPTPTPTRNQKHLKDKTSKDLRNQRKKAESPSPDTEKSSTPMKKSTGILEMNFIFNLNYIIWICLLVLMNLKSKKHPSKMSNADQNILGDSDFEIEPISTPKQNTAQTKTPAVDCANHLVNNDYSFMEFDEFQVNMNISTNDFDDRSAPKNNRVESKTTKTAVRQVRAKRRANNNSFFADIDGVQANMNDSTDDLDLTPPPKKKRVDTKNAKLRKRNLRPEDERTLQILSEKFQSDQNGAVCKVDCCRSNTLKSTKPSNLKRHLQQVHPKEYEQLFPQEVSRKKQIELEVLNAVYDSIELVTINGYPFSLLNASGMRGFIKYRLDPLRLEKQTLAINRLDIVKKVAEMSDIVRNRIKSELNGKTVSVMFDVCTIATLSTFGVNVTYMDDGKVICRSLGIIKIEKRHTAVNLADILFDLLAKFEIPLSKVFSITTDTAKNATNTSEILNMVMGSNSENSADIAEKSIFDVDDDELDFGMDVENEIELQKIIDNANACTLLANETAKRIARKNDSIELINQVNCSAHVLQLAVNDALADSNALAIIGQVKKMCLLMRTQVVMIQIRKLGSKMILPPLDTVTRWNSKYLMVN